MLFMSCVCHAYMYVLCWLLCGYLKRMADLLAIVCDIYCDFVTFPFGIMGQVWFLTVSIPYPCYLSNLHTISKS